MTSAGGDISSLYVLPVVPHGSSVCVRSSGRHVLPIVHFSAVLLLRRLVEGKVIHVTTGVVTQMK